MTGTPDLLPEAPRDVTERTFSFLTREFAGEVREAIAESGGGKSMRAQGAKGPLRLRLRRIHLPRNGGGGKRQLRGLSPIKARWLPSGSLKMRNRRSCVAVRFTVSTGPTKAMPLRSSSALALRTSATVK